MYQLTCKIVIEGTQTWTFEKVSAVKINRSSETLTDTAEITLPKKIQWVGVDDMPICRGDKVTISLGYDNNLEVAFRGYVTTIGAKTPIVIKCEDDMWQLKQMPAEKKAYKKVDLKTLLQDQNIGLDVEVLGEQSIGAYRQDKETVAELLNDLRTQGIRAFMRYDDNGTATLVCGVIFKDIATRKTVFNNQTNIIDDDSLEVQSADDVKIKIKAISIDSNNKRTTVEVGDADGEVKTLYKYEVSETELKAWAEEQLERLKRDGLVGDFETFGHVLIDKLDTIGMIMDETKMGEYQVEANEINYSTSGFRQKITIGNRIS